MRNLQLANEEFDQLRDLSSHQDPRDGNFSEQAVDSGYRTEASVPPALFPMINGDNIVTYTHPKRLSAIIDALALDVFQQSSKSLPVVASSSLLQHLQGVCPRCHYRLDISHDLIDTEPAGKILEQVDPEAKFHLSSRDRERHTHTSCDVCIQTNQVDILADKALLSGSASSSPINTNGSLTSIGLQTDSIVSIQKVAGTQTEGEASNNNLDIVCKETQCVRVKTLSREVLARVTSFEKQSQTNGDTEEREQRPLVSRLHNASQTDVCSIGAFTLNGAEVRSAETQTLPYSRAGCQRDSDITIQIPVPQRDRPSSVKASPTRVTSPNHLAPSSVLTHLLIEDWDSDISADSPSFTSACSSPVSLSPLPIGKLDLKEAEGSTRVETVTFKPIVPNRESMEQASPVTLDENSNRENHAELTRQKTSLEIPPLSHQETSPTKQRRSLDRERNHSSIIQASNGQIVDLTTAEIDLSGIAPEDQELSAKLLEESRKVTEKFQNRRGRKYSPVKKDDAVEKKYEDSAFSSSPNLPKEDDSRTRLIAGEERVGAEGDSDPEEEKAVSRKDSGDFDVKTDIMKAIGPVTAEPHPKPSVSSPKIRPDKKAKRPAFILPMPELSENEEFESCKNPTLQSPALVNGKLEEVAINSNDTCKVDARGECSSRQEGDVKWDGVEGETKARRSSILSDTLLKALGLKKGEVDGMALSEQEVEEKYNSLTFALKTDRMTLDQRYKLQQHQRNVLEQNLQEEIREHTGVVQSLERRCAEDEIARTDINKLKQHIDVIRYALVKLASKAEGYGAVQQEDRLCRAAEVMVTHVENVKRLLDRERADLAEAKRLLHENKILVRGNSTTSLGLDDSDSGIRLRRSSTMTSPVTKHSLHGFVRQKLMRKSPVMPDPNDLDESGRRRASVAAVLGFGGSPPGHMHHASSHNRAQSVPMSLGSKLFPYTKKDGRNRFASLANAAMLDRGALLGSPSSGRGVTLESCKGDDISRSIDKRDSPRSAEKPKKKLSVSLSSPNIGVEAVVGTPIKPLTPPPDMTFSKPPILSRSSSQASLTPPVVVSGADGEEKVDPGKSKSEIEIFQEGFEQGVRSQMSQELNDLRDQQRALCENLEEIMEAAEEDEEEENGKKSQKQPILRWMQDYSRNVPWSKASRLGRLFLMGALFFLALLSIIGTVLPLERCQGGAGVLLEPWELLRRLVAPHTGLYHQVPPPR